MKRPVRQSWIDVDAAGRVRLIAHPADNSIGRIVNCISQNRIVVRTSQKGIENLIMLLGVDVENGVAHKAGGAERSALALKGVLFQVLLDNVKCDAGVFGEDSSRIFGIGFDLRIHALHKTEFAFFCSDKSVFIEQFK